MSWGRFESVNSGLVVSSVSLVGGGSGRPPYGYTAVPRTDGVGCSLEVHPMKIVRRIVGGVLDGRGVTSIVFVMDHPEHQEIVQEFRIP